MKPGETVSPRASMTLLPFSRAREIDAILPFVMPRLRTASVFDSGSMTRPFRITRS